MKQQGIFTSVVPAKAPESKKRAYNKKTEKQLKTTTVEEQEVAISSSEEKKGNIPWTNDQCLVLACAVMRSKAHIVKGQWQSVTSQVVKHKLFKGYHVSSDCARNKYNHMCKFLRARGSIDAEGDM
jgi:hypothetical protein